MAYSRIVTVVFLAALVSACGKPPFEETMLSVCEQGDRLDHAAVTQMDGAGGAEVIVSCNAAGGGGSVIVYENTDADGLTEVARQDFDERVLATAAFSAAGDGPADLLVALGGAHERQVVHLPHEGSGFASPRIVHQSRYEVGRMVSSDVDGDGVMDIVMPEQDAILVNGGSLGEPGSFQRRKIDPKTRLRKMLGDIADVDARVGDEGAYRFQDDGLVRAFTPDGPMDIALGKVVRDIGAVKAAADINGDDRLDLVVTGAGMPEDKVVMLALSEGDSWALSDAVAGLLDPAVVLVRDFDRDGTPDMLVAPRAEPGQDEYAVKLLPGQGNAHFGDPQTMTVSAFPYRMMAGGPEGPADALYLDAEGGRLGLLATSTE